MQLKEITEMKESGIIDTCVLKHLEISITTSILLLMITVNTIMTTVQIMDVMTTTTKLAYVMTINLLPK